MSLDVPAHFASLVCVGFDGVEPTPFIEEAFAAGVSTVILFGRNVGDPAGTAETCRRLREAAGRPIVIAIDQEGGTSRRLIDGFTPVPSMRELARLGPHAVAEAAATTARELRSVGIDFNFAPVVDVDSNPDNPVIGERVLLGRSRSRRRTGFDLDQGDAGRLRSPRVPSTFPGTVTPAKTVISNCRGFPMTSTAFVASNCVRSSRRWTSGVASIMSAHVLFEAIDHRAACDAESPRSSGRAASASSVSRA